MEIDSFFRIDGVFVLASELARPVPDENYIEGAIEITVEGRRVLSCDHWDYIDQLWSYLLDGITAISEGRSFSTFLPDQPVQVCFEPQDAEQVQIRVQDNGVIIASVDRELFLLSMLDACREFFLHLPKVAPGKTKLSKQALARIEYVWQRSQDP